MTALLNELNAATEEAGRLAALDQVQNLYVTEVPSIIAYNSVPTVVYGDKVVGVQLQGEGAPLFEEIGFSAE